MSFFLVSVVGASKYIRQAFQNEWKGTKDANYDYALIMRMSDI
ncbi:MAG: hypothetical protein NTY48_03750 [Candidatus Diapherotrites archaeon]|nr:hypothetical protein [Candidatus Diapherotrites archaeon]